MAEGERWDSREKEGEGRGRGGSTHWHTGSLRTRSQLAIWKYAWGRQEGGKNRGQLEGSEGGGAEGVCSLYDAERGRRAGATKGRGGCTLIYYYSPDLQSAWKVSDPLPPALNGSAMVIVSCI